MEVIGFVGASGTGKSYRSITVSQQYGADAIIDDGLLISHGKVIAGMSAKKEATRIASVKRALFMNSAQAEEMRRAVAECKVRRLMILGTSVGMVEKIALNLGFGSVGKIVHIEEVATQREMDMAVRMRRTEGKHVIPVPTFEIKQDFSGYFLHPLRRFLKNRDEEEKNGVADKSIVRPTFSYMGDYTISDNVLNSIAVHETERIKGVKKVLGISLRKTKHGIHIDMTISMIYGFGITEVSKRIQRSVREHIENYTSVNARRINIYVKNLVK